VRYIRPSPSDAALYDAGFGFASASLVDQIDAEGLAAAKSAHLKFEQWRTRHGKAIDVRWSVEEGQIGSIVARRGCLADLILLQRAGPKGPSIDEAFEAAVYGAGRLVMLVDPELPKNFLDHALIAWNESTESARAMVQSLPFLTECKRVSIFAACDESGNTPDLTELLGYLALHNVQATVLVDGPVAGPVGEALFNVALEAGVTLLVLGAYTHGRVRQMLFGGVTHHVLMTAGLPALMAH
jgi:hypothetical protein